MLRSCRKFLLDGLILISALCGPLVFLATPQQGQQLPHFEVSSIKVVQFDRGGFERQDAGRIDYHITTLLRLVPFAFDTRWYLIQWPKSLPNGGSTRYDLAATFPNGTQVADRRLMMQSLPGERLGLRYHYENRVVPIYSMTVAPGGIKVQKAPPSDTVTTIRSGMGVSPDAFIVNGRMPLSWALKDFEGQLGIPIVDETGVDGDYEIHLSVPRFEAPVSGIQGGDPNLLSAAEIAERNGFDKAAFLSAVEKQLGLRLEKRTIPARVLVIDGIDTVPTPN